MAARNFEKTAHKKGLIVEPDRILDLNDPKWAHPEGAELWYVDPELNASSIAMYDPCISDEDKLKLGNERQKAYFDQFWAAEHTCDIKEYYVPGCPEEPETQAQVLVYTPKNARPRKNRAMFYVIGGGIYAINPNSYPIEELCEKHKCIGVAVIYRLSWQAKYPAAINDLHAGYAWMIEHADELKIHPNKVVLSGSSSGGHLALSTAFRLKRYGYSPRGIVTVSAQTDDIEKEGDGWYTGIWDSVEQHDGLMQDLGRNFNSVRVGPEAMPNHATVEDCIGFPPTFMHQSEMDPDILHNLEFYSKLIKAHCFTELHVYGGAIHNNSVWATVKACGERTEYSDMVGKLYDDEIEYCYKYDLRRPWVLEDYKKRLCERYGLEPKAGTEAEEA